MIDIREEQASNKKVLNTDNIYENGKNCIFEREYKEGNLP